MGRGALAKVRWKNDRIRKKKARDKRKAVAGPPAETAAATATAATPTAATPTAATAAAPTDTAAPTAEPATEG